MFFTDNLNSIERHGKRSRRSTQENEVISLDFEIKERDQLPLQIEQSILNILIVNEENELKSYRQTGDRDSQSDDDEDSSSGGDVISKKFTLKPQHTRKKSQRHRHHHGNNSHRSKGNVKFTTNDSPSIKLHVYRQMTTQGRHHILTKEISLPINSDNEKILEFDKWIQIDMTSTVKSWLKENQDLLSVDLYCESCSHYGLKIVNLQQQEDATNNNPTLNIIGSVIRTKRKTVNKNKKSEKLGEVTDYTITQPKKTFCKQNGDKKCCRHKWVIDFKELGGYDYIIEPRKFDAGFCQGECPYRYNIGNNHAFFQSLARHEKNDQTIPNVCCAPTRFVDMEILHIDENDHTRLKVTTMKKMKAMRCSCT